MTQEQKLLISGWATLATGSPMEIARGMPVLDCEGQTAGQVAAVAVAPLTQEVTHILLCRLPPPLDYRLASLNLVARVAEGALVLRIPSREVEALVIHQPSEG